ncbi:MAG: hypothetical protein C0467_08395 [Planctomycetaceae bacterium]|nr:hypothetical protein [Planctomycetaceae bacterium]
MSDDNGFEVLPADVMREKYGLTAENRPTIKLISEDVPLSLRHLIPLAEQFGIADDLIRSDVVSKTPADELDQMRSLVEANSPSLNEWLAGPAAAGPTWSPEYIAFTCLRMAADDC